MMLSIIKKSLAVAGIVAVAGTAASAQPTWPTRPISLTVAFAAGGVTDGIARQLAFDMSKRLGQEVIVENRGGAGGNIAAQFVARSKPDGYTLLFASSGPAAINKLIYKKMPFDPDKDLEPIVLIGIIPQIIVTRKDLPASNLREFVEYAKTQPGKLTVGNSGVGTSAHITAVLFAQQTGIDVTHVPYRGTAPLTNDLMGGQVDVGMPGFFPQTTNLKMLAVTAAERLKALPDVPTVIETGVSDTVSGLWVGIMGPTGLPKEVVERVNAAVNAYLKSDDAKKMTDALGMSILGGTPEEMKAYMEKEVNRLGPIIEKAGIAIN